MKTKKAEVEILKRDILYKSEIFEGRGVKLNKTLFTTLRFLPMVILLFLFDAFNFGFPFGFSLKLDSLYSFVLALFGVLAFRGTGLPGLSVSISILFYLLALTLAGSIFIYFSGVKLVIASLLMAVKTGLGFYIAFEMLREYKENKLSSFYSINEEKIIVSVKNA